MQERQKNFSQKQYVNVFSNIGAVEGVLAEGMNIPLLLTSMAVSCVSSYFNRLSEIEKQNEIEEKSWQLSKEDINECNKLQVKLLNSSWNLLRQYKLPDEYRLTQDNLDGFFKAVNEPDPEKRLRMLNTKNLERNFYSYPPYWYYRAKAAQEAKNDDEASECFNKFDEVWRPVLRHDPYKVEAEKYRVQSLAKNSEIDTAKVKEHLNIIRNYTSQGDWGNNLFAGVAYFLIGDKNEGIACVEPNIDFDYEKEISGAVLAQMKNGKINSSSLYKELKELQKNIADAKLVESQEEKAEEKEEDWGWTKKIIYCVCIAVGWFLCGVIGIILAGILAGLIHLPDTASGFIILIMTILCAYFGGTKVGEFIFHLFY